MYMNPRDRLRKNDSAEKNVLLSHNINLATRLRVLHRYVRSVLLYGCETWTISKAMKDRLTVLGQ